MTTEISIAITTLEFRWTTSKARDTYGYNICTLYADNVKVARCNGGGYDMKGTCLGNFIASRYHDRLLGLTKKFYGLTFHDPNYDPGKAIIGTDCDNRTMGGESSKTVKEAEDAGESLGLERYQAFYRASSDVPTERHIEPLIDGACGWSSVETIIRAIGVEITSVPAGKTTFIHSLTETTIPN